ncbi:MAG: C4-dicarboxylate transporter, DctM subunit [Rhodobacteraceae bacterium HLUCCA12]|nr:MAG: C4-dicarboxylate transporter, DctM subunit [Rhodobacteraceae bacterium HLUCCA12]
MPVTLRLASPFGITLLGSLVALSAFFLGGHLIAFVGLIVLLLIMRQSLLLILVAGTAFIHVFFARNSSVEYLVQDIWFTLDREVLLAIPMFILAGSVMARGSVARYLVDVMTNIAGPLPGGLAVACIMACAIFAAISGSSIVTLLAIGTIAFPALTNNGYSRRFAIGLICAAGTLGIMIPPSIAMILYGIMTETSITALFTAGVMPGLLLVVMLAAYSVIMNWRVPRRKFRLGETLIAIRKGIPALLMPVILLGGIYSGWFSPTEAAAVALVYAVLVELLIYRDMKVADYVSVIKESVVLLGRLLPLVAIASSLNTIMDYEGITEAWVIAIGEAVENPVLLMISVNILLLLVGCMMEVSSAMVVLSPLLEPIMTRAGFDPVHFGIVMTANLEIGYLTPPVGLNIMVAMVAFREQFTGVVKAVMPFVFLMLVWLMLLSFVPGIALFFAS